MINSRSNDQGQLEVAVLFLVFNRPETTVKVFNAIREVKPKKLYVAADGARVEVDGEKEITEEVRAIATNVDWECEVKTFFRDDNNGCKIAVSKAIDWFFKNEEKGIILEDDCLPSRSFFWFCQDMLEKYKDDSRIAQISGSNILGSYQTGSSYFFSNFGSIWGWATWKRAWKMYDVDMKSWAMSSSNKYNLRKAIGGVVDSFIRIRNFEMTYRGEIDTWDYQWIYARLINRMLIIIPSYNMVSNIGFTGAATHTNISGSKVDNLERYEMSLDYRHPQSFIPSYDFERKITVQKRGMFGCSPIYCIRKILSRFMLLIKGWLYG